MNRSRKRIIVAVDESNIAEHIMNSASELAETMDADVIILTVIELPSFPSEGEVDMTQIESEEKRITEHHKRLIEKYLSGSTQLIESKIFYGDAAKKICEHAKKINAHLVVIGSSGRGKIQSKLLGSVSEKVIKNCHCSVMLLRK